MKPMETLLLAASIYTLAAEGPALKASIEVAVKSPAVRAFLVRELHELNAHLIHGLTRRDTDRH